jgi:carbon-monoxide dehydrogenase small subunit
MERIAVRLTINGEPYEAAVPPRLTLVDFIRSRCGLTGTHVGCEHGVCGACTVLLEGDPIRSCLLFAVQADGCDVVTIEGIAPSPRELHPVQQAFRDAHGLQCGFCTPGFVVTLVAYLRDHDHPTDEELLEVVSGNLCRCTGYQGIINAARLAAGLDQRSRHP